MAKHQVIRRGSVPIEVVSWRGRENESTPSHCLKVEILTDPQNPKRTLMHVQHIFKDASGNLQDEWVLQNRPGTHDEALSYALHFARNHAVPLVIDLAA